MYDTILYLAKNNYHEKTAELQSEIFLIIYHNFYMNLLKN